MMRCTVNPNWAWQGKPNPNQLGMGHVPGWGLKGLWAVALAWVCAAGAFAQQTTPPPTQPTQPTQPNQPAQPTQQRNPAYLCAVLFQANRYETALQYCERAAKESPNAENVYLLAAVQAELGRFTPATDNYRKSIGLNSSFVQAYIGLSRVYIRQYLLSDNKTTALALLDQALSTLREAERVNPKYAPTYATRGLVQAYQSKYDLAIESFNKSLSIKDEPSVRSTLADIYVRQQRWDEAIKNYQQAIQTAPKDANLRIKFASLLLLRGNLEEAIKHLDEAVVLRPGNAEAWLRRGDAYFEKKDWQQAGLSYQQTVALSPVRFPDAYVGLGQVFIETKDYQKAKFNFTKAVALNNDNPSYRYWLCRANELSGDKAGAKAQCEKALQLRPDFPQAKEILDRVR